jgi:hypothetical protein
VSPASELEDRLLGWSVPSDVRAAVDHRRPGGCRRPGPAGGCLHLALTPLGRLGPGRRRTGASRRLGHRPRQEQRVDLDRALPVRPTRLRPAERDDRPDGHSAPSVRTASRASLGAAETASGPSGCDSDEGADGHPAERGGPPASRRRRGSALSRARLQPADGRWLLRVPRLSSSRRSVTTEPPRGWRRPAQPLDCRRGSSANVQVRAVDGG